MSKDITLGGRTFKAGTAAAKIVSYLKKRKTYTTAEQIALSTGVNLKTVRNYLAPSGTLAFVSAQQVSKSGPYTLGYKI